MHIYNELDFMRYVGDKYAAIFSTQKNFMFYIGLLFVFSKNGDVMRVIRIQDLLLQ